MALDLTTLAIKDTNSAPSGGTRGRPAMDNPFITVLKESFENTQAKSVTVPNGDDRNEKGEFKNVVTVLGLIRRAAVDNDLGVRLETVEKGNRTEIRFLGKTKTVRTRKPKEGEASEATNGEVVDATVAS